MSWKLAQDIAAVGGLRPGDRAVLTAYAWRVNHQHPGHGRITRLSG